MHRKAIYKKILGCIFVIIIVISYGSSIMAKVNPNYITPVDSSNLNKSVADSSLMKAVAHLVYGGGQIIEWIAGTIFTMLTGTNDFPWADKIVFNAVPLLDVNFISPDKNSFLGQKDIASAIKNTYQTVFSMATVAFGIIVLIMAIKLVISTIASEKAKYKQALVNWVTGLVMLFMMHFFISFMFYLNETLVNACFGIAKEVMKEANTVNMIKVSDVGNDIIKRAEEKHKKLTTANGTNCIEVLKKYPQALNAWVTLQMGDDDKGITKAIDWKVFDKTQLKIVCEIIENAGSGAFKTDKLNREFEIKETSSSTVSGKTTIHYNLTYKEDEILKIVDDDYITDMLGGNGNAKAIKTALKINKINSVEMDSTNPISRSVYF